MTVRKWVSFRHFVSDSKHSEPFSTSLRVLVLVSAPLKVWDGALKLALNEKKLDMIFKIFKNIVERIYLRLQLEGMQVLEKDILPGLYKNFLSY